MSKKVMLTHSFAVGEIGEDAKQVLFKEGETVEVLHEFDSNNMASGRGYVIFNGSESTTVCKSITLEVE